MAPLEWDKIMKADLENLENDGDTFFEMLKDFDPEKESDPSHLKQLFRVCQSVMNIKNEQLAEVIADMENEARKDAKRVEKLQTKVKELEMDLRHAKKFSNEKESPSSTKYLRETVLELEDQIHQLNKHKDDLQRDLNEEKRANEKYNDQVKNLEKYNNELRDEVNQMRQDNSYYKKQLQIHRDNLMSQNQEEDPEYKLKLIAKNQELSEAMEELQNLTDNNEELKKNCDILTSKLSEVTKNMEQLTDDYLKLKKITQEEDTVNDRLRAENQYMKTQISDLNERFQSKSDSDDAIMIAVSHKVEEWKTALAEKDEEILTYQKEIIKLRRQLEALNMDADRASVAALTKVIEEKDKQINELTEEMKNYADEIEINAAVIEDLGKNPSKAERGPVDNLQKKIQEQQALLRHKELEVKEAQKLYKEADKDACDKDKQLCEALERMRQYESGEYGLADAVSEIKDLKKQLKIRERKNEELIQLINKSETDMNELTDENECLREQLGMDPKKPVDIKDFQSKISVKREEQRALNIVLQKEIERLEEERIMLKQNIRKLAQQTGQRAVALGLTADDMVSIQNYTENLKVSKINRPTTQDTPDVDDLKIKNIELNNNLTTNLQQLKQLYKEKDKLQTHNEQLEEENKSFQDALKEIHADLKKRGSADSEKAIIECPSLEKMIAVLEVRNAASNSDMSSYTKGKVDALLDQKEELKKALNIARQEANFAKLESEKAVEKIKKLEHDILYLQQRGNQAGIFQPLVVPEGLPASSAEVIANLNEHLIVTLEDLFLNEEQLQKTETSLESYRCKMAAIKHQQGLLYSDYLNEKKEHENDIIKLRENIRKLEELREQDEIQLKEFDEISKLKHESIAMEKAVAERIGYLQRFKDTAMFQISALQKALEESVCSVDLERANKEYQNLTEKYRDLLEKENVFVSKSEAVSNLEEDVKRLKSENEHLKKILEMEKDKVHTLEENMEKLFQKGMATSKDLIVSNNPQSLAKRMAMVEMKELHERQRAEHAVNMYEKYKTVLRDLERRNKELEENMSKVSQVNLELQRTERELRDELANSVTKEVSDADRKRITDLEKSEMYLKNEISKLKEVADVATSQVRALEMQQISRDKEVISLQQQLLDFQAQSDEKTVIGKLHRHIVQLQISEGTAVQKLESALQKVSKLEAQVLRLEQQIDEKNQSIYHNRNEAQNKIKHLKRNLFDVRRQFAGAVPLSKQETFTRNMVQIREDKLKTEQELQEVQVQRKQMEDKVLELQLLQSSQKELLETTLKGSHAGANKLTEWHSKLEALRLTELKQKRDIVKLQEKISFLEKTNKHQEMTINEIETDYVRASKEFEEHQLIWEQRELELEKVISNMEKRASDIANVAAQFGKTVGNIPDASQPVAVQLEQAISTIKQNMKTISESQAEAKVLKQQTEKLESAVREAEKALIAKDKLISEIRLRMPATADRDSIIQRAAASAVESVKQDSNYDDSNNEQAMKVAQCAISSLKARIQLKEESIQKLQDLLKAAHNDMEKMSRKHFEELQEMQLKLHANTDKSFHNFKEAAREIVNKTDSDTDFSQQMNKITVLEELVAEHEDALNAMVERLKEKDEEILILRKKLQQTTEQMDKEKEDLLKQHGVDVSNKDIENEKMVSKIKEQEKDIEILKEEISAVKNANSRTPSANMKRLVEQLRNQLSLKENQNQALGKALSKIRAEMVEQAEETLKAHQEEKKQELNMQKLVEKHTEELKEQNETLRAQNERIKNDLKKKREKEQDLESQLEEAQEEITKKNTILQRLKSEKQKLQFQVEELEKRNPFKSVSKKSSEDESQELNEMRRRVRFLEDEVKRKQEQAEKPYEQAKTEKSKNVELIKWEERKKWERTFEKMKTKLKETESEVVRHEKEVKHLKIALERLQREKESLEAKMKTMSKTHDITSSSTTSRTVRQDFKLKQELHDLKDINFQQTEELSKLKRQLAKDQDQIVKELAEENKYLVKEVEEMKKALKAKFAKEKESQSCAEYQAVFEKNQELQKQLLHLSKENIEIHFEMEQAKKDVPRLKARVEDLQIYVDALKEENNRLDGDRSGIKKVGESGKSPKELEKIIALLKKVVDRLQAENEQLKKLAVIVSQKEQKIENEEKKTPASPDKHFSKEKGSAKLLTDHEKLRKNFQKENEIRLKLENQVKHLMDENKKLTNRITEGNTKLDGDVASIRNVEELENKHQLLADVKTLLRESAEREQSLLKEKQELLKQIDILKNCSMESINTDANLRKSFQEARLKINQLEKEKEQLLTEVKILQQNVHGKTTESPKDMLEKAKEYESLKANNVELQLELRNMKLENKKSVTEIQRMKRELDNFGPEFIEEIENLKCNYKESVKKNVLQEDQLKYLGEKFGISVNIPGSEQ